MAAAQAHPGPARAGVLTCGRRDVKSSASTDDARLKEAASMTIDAIAAAFSGHRFADAYPFLADDVQWELVGGPTLRGPDEVRAACEATLSGLEGIETEFRRFRTIVCADSVVVDAIGATAIRTGTQRSLPATSTTSPMGGSSGSRPTRSNCRAPTRSSKAPLSRRGRRGRSRRVARTGCGRTRSPRSAEQARSPRPSKCPRRGRRGSA